MECTVDKTELSPKQVVTPCCSLAENHVSTEKSETESDLYSNTTMGEMGVGKLTSSGVPGSSSGVKNDGLVTKDVVCNRAAEGIPDSLGCGTELPPDENDSDHVFEMYAMCTTILVGKSCVPTNDTLA